MGADKVLKVGELGQEREVEKKLIIDPNKELQKKKIEILSRPVSAVDVFIPGLREAEFKQIDVFIMSHLKMALLE